MSPETTNKPHISDSQMRTLAYCGILYSNRYIDGRIIPPGIAAARGLGVHHAAAKNGKQKIQSGVDLPLADLRDIAAEAFNTQLDTEGIWLNPEEMSIGPHKVLGQAKDETVRIAEFYGTRVAPDYQPVKVEETFRVELPGPRDYLGVIDLIDDQQRVRDFKTAAKSKTQAEADSSIQLTGYAAGHQVLTGLPASDVGLEVLVTTSTGVSRQTLVSHRDAKDFDVLAARINAANRVIDAGAFLPADPSHWLCSAKWCGFHSTCPYAGGRRR